MVKDNYKKKRYGVNDRLIVTVVRVYMISFYAKNSGGALYMKSAHMSIYGNNHK